MSFDFSSDKLLALGPQAGRPTDYPQDVMSGWRKKGEKGRKKEGREDAPSSSSSSLAAKNGRKKVEKRGRAARRPFQK